MRLLFKLVLSSHLFFTFSYGSTEVSAEVSKDEKQRAEMMVIGSRVEISRLLVTLKNHGYTNRDLIRSQTLDGWGIETLSCNYGMKPITILVDEIKTVFDRVDTKWTAESLFRSFRLADNAWANRKIIIVRRNYSPEARAHYDKLIHEQWRLFGAEIIQVEFPKNELTRRHFIDAIDGFVHEVYAKQTCGF